MPVRKHPTPTSRDRREQLERELSKAATRQRLKALLGEGLDILRDAVTPLMSWSLASLSQRIYHETGLIVFEPRTLRFEGPVIGVKGTRKRALWVTTVDTTHFPKQFSWDEWSLGGTCPEPDGPVVCTVNPVDGSTNLTGIIASDAGLADASKAERRLKACLESWLSAIQLLEEADTAEAQRRLKGIEAGVEKLLAKKAKRKFEKPKTSSDDPDREQILKAWQTGKYRTYAACAKALGLKEKFNNRSPEKRVKTVVRASQKKKDRQQLKAEKARATR